MMKKQIRDQALHFLWAFIALLPILLMGGIAGGALSGLILGLPRELIDQQPIKNWKDTILDIAFFTIGGAVAGSMFWLS
jgi:hypothetical protein